MAEHRVWSLNRLKSKYCDWTFYSWNSLCCSGKLNFSSSLRPPCSPHHEGNMPAPFTAVTNQTKKCFLKRFWEKPFLESCYKSRELSSYQLQGIQRHQELSQMIIQWSCCYNMYYWTLQNVITLKTLSPYFHNNKSSYRGLQIPQKYFIFNFALLSIAPEGWEQTDNWSKPVLSHMSGQCET